VPLRTLLLAVLALALCSAAAELPNPAQIRQTAGAVTRDIDLQSRLPQDSGTMPPAPKRSSNDGLSGGSDGFSVPAPAAVLSLVQWVLIAAAAVAVVALLAILWRAPLDSRPRPPVSPGSAPEASLPPADPRHLLARADELAAAGRFAEAMHYVLLAAMARLAGGQQRKSADSLTSWELLRAAALAPHQSQALRDLVLRVERAWFGQRPAGPDDYRQVRGSFEEFVSPAKAMA